MEHISSMLLSHNANEASNQVTIRTPISHDTTLDRHLGWHIWHILALWECKGVGTFWCSGSLRVKHSPQLISSACPLLYSVVLMGQCDFAPCVGNFFSQAFISRQQIYRLVKTLCELTFLPFFIGSLLLMSSHTDVLHGLLLIFSKYLPRPRDKALGQKPPAPFSSFFLWSTLQESCILLHSPQCENAVLSNIKFLCLWTSIEGKINFTTKNVSKVGISLLQFISLNIMFIVLYIYNTNRPFPQEVKELVCAQ